MEDVITNFNGTNLKAVYEIEYITDPEKWDMVCRETHDAPWELYERKTFEDDLGGAMAFYMYKVLNPDCFDARFFETIYVGDQAVRERIPFLPSTFRHSVKNIVNKDLQDQNEMRKEEIAAQGKMISTYQEFIKKYNATNLFEKFVRNED